uniref:Uncharacterized protein n=1 Tax=Zea mays TaxID=4577 RepID=B4FNH1_MAIZE|nr:unknown [Zea mays]
MLVFLFVVQTLYTQISNCSDINFGCTKVT